MKRYSKLIYVHIEQLTNGFNCQSEFTILILQWYIAITSLNFMAMRGYHFAAIFTFFCHKETLSMVFYGSNTFIMIILILFLTVFVSRSIRVLQRQIVLLTSCVTLHAAVLCWDYMKRHMSMQAKVIIWLHSFIFTNLWVRKNIWSKIVLCEVILYTLFNEIKFCIIEFMC